MAKAKTSRYSRRTGATTINVNVPRTRSRAAPRRTSTTRTLRQVYTPKKDNTALVVGAAALAVGAAVLLWPRGASAALPPVPDPGQPGGPPVGPGTVPMNPAFPQVPGGPAGYAGPGTYRVTAPSGLNVRPQPNTSQATITTLSTGTAVEVVAALASGWVQISTPQPGYLCMSCADAPGGPWLVREA